jgi:hypothetical protein
VIAETARIHEQAGFDRALIGYFYSLPRQSTPAREAPNPAKSRITKEDF